MTSHNFDRSPDDTPDWDLTEQEVYEAVKHVDRTKSSPAEEVYQRLVRRIEERHKAKNAD